MLFCEIFVMRLLYNLFMKVLIVLAFIGMMRHDKIRAQLLEIPEYQQITENKNGFNAQLSYGDRFGYSATCLKDLNGDSIQDLVVGAPGVDDGNGYDKGAIWILFLHQDGTVKSHQKISDTTAGFKGVLSPGDQFGDGLESIGDINGDSIPDIAVGGRLADGGGNNKGGLWVLHMKTDGHVKGKQKITAGKGGFTGGLNNEDNFGNSITIGDDYNGDGIQDLVVGAPGDDDGGTNRGALWILYMDSNYTVKDESKISQLRGDFDGMLEDGAAFGKAVDNIGDINNDGISDLVVGAPFTNSGKPNKGSIWVLLMDNGGEVKRSQRVSASTGNFSGNIKERDRFGTEVEAIWDINCDSNRDIAVAAPLADDGGVDRGAIWLLYLTDSGTVSGYQKISDTTRNWNGSLRDTTLWGIEIVNVGDLNGDSYNDLSVSSLQSEPIGKSEGTVWPLLMQNRLPFQLSPADTTLCQGDSIFLQTHLSWNPRTPLLYKGFDQPLLSVWGDTVWRLSPDGTLMDTVQVESSLPRCDIQGNETARLSVIPPIGLAALPDTTLCQGDTVRLSLQHDSNLIWQPTHHLSQPDTSAPLVFPDTTTPYQARAANRCFQDTTDITVSVIPPVQLTTSPDTTICRGDSVTLQVQYDSTYTWWPEQGLPDTLDPAPVVSPDTTTIYRVKARNRCFSDTASIKVAVRPPPPLTLRPERDTICRGDSIQIDASHPGGPLYDYKWLDTTALINANSAVPWVFPDSTASYRVEVSDLQGCTHEDTAHITVRYPFTHFITPHDTTICSGDTVLLRASMILLTGPLYMP